MLPLQIEKRFRNPGELERLFLNYLKKSNAPINQSKSIASSVLSHAKDVSLQSSVDFFTGTFIASDTNIVGNFVRPESEHLLIYGVRLYSSNRSLTAVDEQPWLRGLAGISSDVLVSSTCTINVNSVRLLKRIPLTEFDLDITTKDRGTLFLDEPILWQGQTELRLSLNAPDGATIGDVNFIKFDLVGIGLI